MNVNSLRALLIVPITIALAYSIPSADLKAQGSGKNKSTSRIKMDDRIFDTSGFVKSRRDSASADDIKRSRDQGTAAHRWYRIEKNPLKGGELYQRAIILYPDPHYYYELGNCLIDMRDYENAIRSYDISAKLNHNKIHLVYYNAACAASLMEDKERALLYLERALAKGYTNTKHIRNDRDLRYIRGFPEFENLIVAYEALAQTSTAGLSVLEKKLVGIWHISPALGSGWSDTYQFFPNRVFYFNYSQMDCDRRTLSIGGTWRVERDSLILTISNKKIKEGGRLVPATGSCTSQKEIQGGIVKMVRVAPPEIKRHSIADPIYDRNFDKNRTTIGKTKFWKMSENPEDYR
jgi:hypothetical protein